MAAANGCGRSACQLAEAGETGVLSSLEHAQLHAPDRYGGLAVHWAAGSGQLATLRWLIEVAHFDPESEGAPPSRRAWLQAPRRRPLHYAARNGQLDVVRYLLEEVGVDVEPRARHGVTPFQLAVWQNRLHVVRYLVEHHSADPRQVNNFACGAQHWIGTAPAAQAGADGEDLLPLARYLRERGVNFHVAQRQGHTPLHKAAWGGHSALCRWLRDECGAVDDKQDLGGNYAADEAEMGGHVELAVWLRAECSGARALSCAVLGLPPNTTDPTAIRAAYLRLSRRLHPDGATRAAAAAAQVAEEKAAKETVAEPCADFEEALRGDVAATAESGVTFEQVAAAYDHLTRLGGRGDQANPTHSLRKMLQATGGDEHNWGETGAIAQDIAARSRGVLVASARGNRCCTSPEEARRGFVTEARSLFKAKLAAVAHEYGCSGGLPISKLRCKYSQVWRGEVVPQPEVLGMPPRAKLIDLLRSFDDVVSLHEDPTGANKPVLIRAIISREAALGLQDRGRDEEGAAVSASSRTCADEQAFSGTGTATIRPTSQSPCRSDAPSDRVGHETDARADISRSVAVVAGENAPTVNPSGAGNTSPFGLPVLIMGGGIGGLAAAVALQSHGVRCIVYERDGGWDHRRRGYGLTLSNATALAALGVEEEVRMTNGCCSSDAHWVFDDYGQVLGYFGTAFNGVLHELRGNLRVPRQTLRRLLVKRLAPGTVRWGWKLVAYTEDSRGGIVKATIERVSTVCNESGRNVAQDGLTDQPSEKSTRNGAPRSQIPAGITEDASAALLAEAAVPVGGRMDVTGCVLLGADGVRSTVRSQKVGDSPRYVGVVVVLGESTLDHPLLRGQGFYTVDGTHRMFTMPLEPMGSLLAGQPSDEAKTSRQDPDEEEWTVDPRFAGKQPHTTMWQLSFALPDEESAIALCAGGSSALLREVRVRCAGWHPPVAEMLATTDEKTVWGTPLLDRAPMPQRSRRYRDSSGRGGQWTSRVSVLGDAAHPMTPFKGQGANMALADAPLLGKCLGDVLGEHVPPAKRRDPEKLFNALSRYEREMMSRAQRKVEASRDAAVAYHSSSALSPLAYGISGVPPELLEEVLDELRARGLGASASHKLEPQAVDAWNCVQARIASKAIQLEGDDFGGASCIPTEEARVAVVPGFRTPIAVADHQSLCTQHGCATQAIPVHGRPVIGHGEYGASGGGGVGPVAWPMRCSACARTMDASMDFTLAQRRKPDATRRCKWCVAEGGMVDSSNRPRLT